MLAVSPTLTLIIKKTLPLSLGLFAVMLVQLVDSVFISRLGLNELSVHGITLPFQAGLIGLQVGIGVAATSIISRAAGAKQHAQAGVTASLAFIFGLLFIALICLLLIVFTNSIFASFVERGPDEAQFELLLAIFAAYWPVWLLSASTGAALYLATCVYRANGDTKTTGAMFVLASVINLILDPLLMFSLDMGIQGAAIASTLGYGLSTLVMLLKAKNKNWFYAIRFKPGTLKCFTALINMAIPTTANQLLPSAGAFVGMMLIARLGTEEIAFWSLLARIESFLLVFTLALTMSVPPMIGRYLGKAQPEKIAQVVSATAKFVLVYHLLVAVILALASQQLIPTLSQDTGIQLWLSSALWIIPFSYGTLGLCMVVASIFNALGLAKIALLVSFARLFVLYIPALLIGTLSGSVLQVVIAATAANFLAGGFAWYKLSTYIKSNLSGNTIVNQRQVRLLPS
ncbi:MATE family efflux transporter [Agarivorans sp. Toyoura001]|uniref:MATE family efflux transporter n=1 Tax=Agarivorans sp. Toyoura001 TaxID=2283141 RepID=UPI0010F3B259|nr:MATE family efflux transporter [Agarivorans sp. Toyoura001]GDY25904.1 MATE family efflux transporter [Agarivorans sp. Toyoura001]